MKINHCHNLFFLLVLRILMGAMPVQAAKNGDSTMNVKPAHARFVQGEPLKFNLTLHNRSDLSMKIELGPGGVENLYVTVTKDGRVNTATAPVRGGIQRLFFLEAPAHSSMVHSFFLDDIIRLSEPGTYELSVQITGSEMPSAVTEFEILPNLEMHRSLLEKHYLEICRILLSSTSSSQQRKDARKAIVLFRSPLALGFQETMLQLRSWEDGLEYEQLVDSMVSLQSPQATRCLVQFILSNPVASTFEKTVVLNHLRVAGAEKWQGPVNELLKPYLKDIGASVPMSISD